MNFNNFLKKLFGDKSTRDMKLIQPFVESVKAVYPEIKALDNDQLRAKQRKSKSLCRTLRILKRQRLQS